MKVGCELQGKGVKNEKYKKKKKIDNLVLFSSYLSKIKLLANFYLRFINNI